MMDEYIPRRDPETGELYIPVHQRGIELLNRPLLNKGTAWPQDERDALGLTGLLPPSIATEEEQLERVYRNFQREKEDIDKFIFLQGLMDRNETLFYRLVMNHLEEMMPIVYTPTVGQACREFHKIFRRPRGIWIDAENVHRTPDLLRMAARGPVEVSVVSDGERILGLGDLGAGGMGIPIGKLSLYIAGAGFHPANTLPILLDVGTDNQELLTDPLYMGRRHPRLRGEEYDRVVEAFVQGFQAAFPGALLQWEDFAKGNAFRLLEKYKNRLPCFNDDIQGTGAVTLSGMIAATKVIGGKLKDHRYLFIGSGEGGVGIARVLRAALAKEGAGTESIFMQDSRGLLVKGRAGMEDFKSDFARDLEEYKALGLETPESPIADLIRAIKPTILIGITGQPGVFDERIVRTMGEINDRPVIFALSNPNSKSEAVPQAVYEWTDGRALMATGSPFPDVNHGGRTVTIGQCNNAFIFPGVGLATKVSRPRMVTPEMFAAAAYALADCIEGERLRNGTLFPSQNRLREVSVKVATAACQEAVNQGLSEAPAYTEWGPRVVEAMWEARYHKYRFEP